jgi:hypothetical protein
MKSRFNTPSCARDYGWETHCAEQKIKKTDISLLTVVGHANKLTCREL